MKSIYPRDPNASQYIKKTIFPKPVFIEPNRSAINDHLQIAKSYFTLNFHWIPEYGVKNLQYYSDILQKEKSIIINTIRDKADTSKIIYRSVYLVKFIPEEKWGPTSASTKVLPNSPVPYSYYDYIIAWFRFTLHQNETMTHLWFVNFDKAFNDNDKLPLWFIRW